MPKINKLELPTVTLDMTGDEIEALSAKLATEPMSPEGMIETAIYLRRQIEKAEDLNEAVKVLAGRLKEFYGSLNPEQRDTRRVKVGMATYTEAGEKIELKDRDFTVENLTAEQLRITYKPDLKSMETILKPDEFERHTKRTPTPAKVTIRDNRASSDFEELDF
jgi:hypothetical protein